MSSQAFVLKKPPVNNALFMPTDPASSHMAALLNTGESVVGISVDKIQHYRNHTFKLYEGERLNDMIESIRDYGILAPLLVRQINDGEYEVFVGHNRLEGGKHAGLSEVPCIIKNGLSDEEINVISKLTNLLQRGFSDLPHSERADALVTYYNAIKRQGRRTDLIKRVEELLIGDAADNPKNPQLSDSETNTPAGNKSIDIIGEKYGLSRNSVARYIRVNDLIAEFKELLDSEELSIRAGVDLSYINDIRQQTIFEQSQRYGVRIGMKQAERLRALDSKTTETDDDFLLGCADILSGRAETEKEAGPKKVIKLKLERSAVESYFEEDETEEAMQDKVLEALAFYHRFYDRYKEQLAGASGNGSSESQKTN